MSYQVTVVIVCDHPHCPNRLTYSRINRGGMNKTWAAYAARENEGWWVRGVTTGTDPTVAYCPTHRAEHGK